MGFPITRDESKYEYTDYNNDDARVDDEACKFQKKSSLVPN